MPARFLKSKQSPVPGSAQVDVDSIVRSVIDDVRANGDAAVRKYSEKFDKWSPASFKLSQADVEASIAQCSAQTIEDIKKVQHNVRAFAQAQKDSLKDFEFESQPVSFLHYVERQGKCGMDSLTVLGRYTWSKEHPHQHGRSVSHVEHLKQ